MAAPTSRAKYRYKELADKKNGPLPKDVNDSVIKALEFFRCPELLKLLGEVRNLRLFGTVEIRDHDGLTWATVECHNGIAVMYYRYTHMTVGKSVCKPALPYTITLRQSDKNKDVLMRENKNTQEGGNAHA